MNTIREYKKELITGIVLGFLLYFFLKYLFPLISPFFFAYVTIYSIYPFLYHTKEKWKIGKTVTTIILLSFVMLVLTAVLCLFLYFGEENLYSLRASFHHLGQALNSSVIAIGEWAETKIGISADLLEQTAGEKIDEFFLNGQITGSWNLMKSGVICAKKVLPVFAFIGIYLIATVLFSKDFDGLMEQVHRVGALDALMSIMEGLLHTIGTYLRAQCIILFLIALICATGLKLMGISYGILLGILAGILDALPFIGTGIVLIPTALILLIQGKLWKGILVFLIYLLCMGVREVLEPRLMGKRLGIYPVILLLSIYAGVRLFGISGIVKGPFGVVLFKQVFMRIFMVKS